MLQIRSFGPRVRAGLGQHGRGRDRRYERGKPLSSLTAEDATAYRALAALRA